MIANIKAGKSFRPTLLYNLQKVKNHSAERLDSSFANSDEKGILREVNMVRMLRPNLGMFFYHISLSFPPWENPNDDLMKQIAREYLEKMGFDQHQYAIFKHNDASHPHLHILVSRIGYDGSVISNFNDYRRSEQVLRKLEEIHDLTKVISSRLAKEKALSKNELEMMKRTDEPTVKMKLQIMIMDILKLKPSTSEFIRLLEAKNILVFFNNSNRLSVQGISFGFEGIKLKGSHLGNAYKWQAIKHEIDYEQERDRTAVHEANVRTVKRIERNRGISGDQKNPALYSAIISQGVGKLQDQIGRTSKRPTPETGADRKNSGKYGMSDPKDHRQRGTNQQSEQSDRKKMDDPAVSDRDLIRGLRGTDHLTLCVDSGEVIQNRQKKRKKGLRI